MVNTRLYFSAGVCRGAVRNLLAGHDDSSCRVSHPDRGVFVLLSNRLIPRVHRWSILDSGHLASTGVHVLNLRSVVLSRDSVHEHAADDLFALQPACRLLGDTGGSPSRGSTAKAARTGKNEKGRKTPERAEQGGKAGRRF